jgi:phosphoribosylamine--glycine ligase
LKALIVGAGGREHALAWHMAREGVDVTVAPGNGGTPGALNVQTTDVDALAGLAEQRQVDLTIIGPEAPLAGGLVDAFASRGLRAFGPKRAAARLESSKAWAKEFLVRHGIPTARAEVVDGEAAARRAISRTRLPSVLKADGLAAGKGVFVVSTQAELEAAIEQLFRQRTLGDAANQVLVEEYLEGPEVSVLAFTDGQRLAVMPPARDYKRLHDGDQGPNTGGMGGYTRPGYASTDVLKQIERTILRPTLQGMAAEGQPYQGVLYAGLILTRDGPQVLEFNCRFGDPECQLIMPLLHSSLFEACAAVTDGCLDPDEVRWVSGRTYGVVLASPGYPEAPQVGAPIAGLDEVGESVQVFHAGTRLDGGGRLVTAGGRVLTLVGAERDAVYVAADAIRFAGKQLRRDIGAEAPTVVALGAAS